MILSADLGSTNLKAALFAKSGKRLAESSAPLPYTLLTNLRAELSPKTVKKCFFQILDKLSSEFPQGQILKVSLTSQAQTFCITDKAGNSCSPFFGWSDARAVNEAAHLQDTLGKVFYQECGWPEVTPLHMISKVLWWRRRHGWSEQLRVVSLPSFLAMQLGFPHSSDTNLAAMTGFSSIPRCQWWERAFEAVDIPATSLGALVPPGEVIEQVESKAPEKYRGIDLVMAGNDHTAGAIGSGCHPGRCILTLGTAGVIYRYAGKVAGPYSKHGAWGPYPGGGYYELLSLDHACSALDRADEFLFGKVNSPHFVEKAQEAKTHNLSPLFDPSQGNLAIAWSGNGTQCEKAYAVLEGIAFSLLSLAEGTAFLQVEEMIILGGGSRLNFWVQIVADIFQKPIIKGASGGLEGASAIAGIKKDETTSRGKTFLPSYARFDLNQRRYRRWCTTFFPI